MDIHKVLANKYSDRKYTCRGIYPDHEIEWLDDGPVPTDEEIETKAAELEVEEAAKAYRSEREKEYPPLEELTVALWETIADIRKGVVESTAYEEFDDLENKRQQVKTKYPKPE